MDLADGTNPATTPQDTAMLASMTTVAAQQLTVTRVVGQDVLNAARPGDEVQTSLSGFASETKVPLALCGTTCGRPVDATTIADGSGTGTLLVPADAATGTGTVRATAKLGKDTVVLDQPMRVLAAPTVRLGDTSDKNRLRVVGAEWDPLRQVSVTAVDGSGTPVGTAVSVAAAATGAIDAELTVAADAEVAGVVATQDHRGTTLKATVDVTAGGAGGGSDAGDGAGNDTGNGAGDNAGNGAGNEAGNNAGSGAGTGSGSSPSAVSPPGAAPIDIPAPVDLPVTTVADPQAAAGAAELAVTKVSLTGSTRFGDLMGGGPDRVLKLRVENVGTAEVVAPGLSIAVGKGEKVDPVYSSDGFARLAPGKSLTLQIPIGLPAGAFGVYTISGQVGEGSSGAFSTTFETYPWGLFALNALGVLLIAFAIRRRIFAPAPSRVASLAGPPPAAGASSGDGAAVIDLAVLERWWALQADGEGVPVKAGADMTADAVVDVDAVERWLERCSARQAQGDQISAKSTS
ncbi:hypothetical protein [Aeromicrobium wangtongii]|uniref:Uncharacterized protein n=1 Tax=Aeromicrobium wangtongii TaxID=2969247 RepID=A0ABY5M471_9ACTN|nr:hypothetical protein [Aeromicrobium wangtongii]UUP12637.1 hypothetical protein NQV15_12310 [Aeromicrobium wangtongii]